MALLVKKTLNKLKDIDVKITTGQETKTNEVIDGKRVYKKRINCGAGPNNDAKIIDTGLSNVTYVKVEGIVVGINSVFPINNTRPFGSDQAFGVYVNTTNKQIVLESVADRSAYTVYVDLYYTKN